MSNIQTLRPPRNYSSDSWKNPSLKIISKSQKFYLDYGPNQDLKISYQNFNGDLLPQNYIFNMNKKRMPLITPINQNLPPSFRKGLMNQRYQNKQPRNKSYKKTVINSSKTASSSSVANKVSDTRTLPKIHDSHDLLHFSVNISSNINSAKKVASTKINNEFLKRAEKKDSGKKVYMTTKHKTNTKFYLKTDHNDNEYEDIKPIKLILSENEKEEKNEKNVYIEKEERDEKEEKKEEKEEKESEEIEEG